MRNLATVGCGLLLCAASAPSNDAVLQARLDTILVAAGQPAGSIAAVWSDDEELRIAQPGHVVAVPKAVVALAPSAQALDGLLAMLAAYQQPAVLRNRKTSAAEVAAVAALTAITGGATEDGSSSNRVLPVIPDGSRSRSVADTTGRQMAWKGVRWSTAAGACTEQVTSFMRLLLTDQETTVGGQKVKLLSEQSARRILRDMGSLAYPSSQDCTTRDDAGFDRLRSSVAS